MAADADFPSINNAHPVQSIYGCLSIGYYLRDESIIHGFRIANYWHLSIVQDSIALG